MVDNLEDTEAHGRHGSIRPRGANGLCQAPRQDAIVWFSSFVINLLGLGLPVVLLQVYDRILPYQASQTLALLIVGLMVVLLLDAILRVLRASVTGWSAAQFEHLTACSAVQRLLSLPVHEFEREPPGVHLDRLAAINAMRDHYSGQAKLLFLDFPFVAIFLGLIYFIAGEVVFVPLIIFSALALAAFFVGKQLKEALADRAVLDDRRYSFVIEILGGIHTIKLLGMEPQMQRRYERLQESAAGATHSVTLLGNIAQSVGWFFSNLTMISVATVGALAVMDGRLSIGGLAACTLLSGRSVQPVLRGLGLWSQYQAIEIAKERIARLFEKAPESSREEGKIGPIEGSLTISGLTFSYGDGAHELFKDLSLQVAAGEVIGVTSESGAGKTTLLMLLMGLLRPVQGKIEIDGTDIQHFNPQNLRRQIAFLPQTATLFQGTILDNLTLFEGGQGLEDALWAARLVGVDEAVRHLPEGYETKVGKGAPMELPVGLKQGIAIARAIARKPKIILFDEANGGLDSAADVKLKEALAELKGHSTIVIVSHRPSLLNLADRKFQLNESGLTLLKDKKPGTSKARSRIDTLERHRGQDDKAAESNGGHEGAPSLSLKEAQR